MTSNKHIEIINYLTPLIARFPFFPMSNISYNRNFVLIINEALKIQEESPDIIGNLHIKDNCHCKITYLDGTSYKYDDEKVAKLEEKIINLINEIIIILVKPINLVQDIKKLKSDKKNFEANSKKLIQVSPFLYDGEGEALTNFELKNFSFKNFELNQIQSLYSDLFKEHLAPLLTLLSNEKGFGQIHKITRNCLSQFIEKEIIPATTYYSNKNQTAKEKTLILEEVPTIMTPLRGAIGGDCSMMSVPYYGLLKSTKVFWIIRSDNENEKPAGYVLIAECDVNGEILPFVVTINGPTIQTVDCHMVYKLLSILYKCDEVLIANWNKNEYLINSTNIRDSINTIKNTEVQVNIPPAWDCIPSGGYFQDYYAISDLQNGLKINTQDISTQITKIHPIEYKNFYTKSKIEEVSLTGRSIISYYFNNLIKEKSEMEEIEETLNISHEHTINIKLLVDLYQNENLSVKNFKVLNKNFDFNLSDFSRLSLPTRSKILRDLFTELRDDYPINKWKSLCVRTFAELKTELDSNQSYYSRLTQDSIKNELASIPDEFIPNYWEEIKPYFYFKDQAYPDYYILKRFISHFHSYGTIEQFLEFLVNVPQSLSTQLGLDSRWKELFLRAKDLMPENEDYKKIVRKIYYQESINPESNFFYTELATLYCNGLNFLDEIDPKVWLEEIFTSRNYDDAGKIRVMEFIERYSM